MGTTFIEKLVWETNIFKHWFCLLRCVMFSDINCMYILDVSNYKI